MNGWRLAAAIVGLVAGGTSVATAAGGDPPALNPFGAGSTSLTSEREDAIPGYLELSNGAIEFGRLYLTRDKRLKIYDEQMKRQREIPLSACKQIDCAVVSEWMEKEWRFKELAANEKYFTGREYPAREYVHTVTLKSDKTIKGGLSGIVYIVPGETGPTGPLQAREPKMYQLHKRDKGDFGKKLPALLFVKRIKLGEEAYEEGKRKAAGAIIAEPPARGKPAEKAAERPAAK